MQENAGFNVFYCRKCCRKVFPVWGVVGVVAVPISIRYDGFPATVYRRKGSQLILVTCFDRKAKERTDQIVGILAIPKPSGHID
jgi:hypothetical protein